MNKADAENLVYVMNREGWVAESQRHGLEWEVYGCPKLQLDTKPDRALRLSFDCEENFRRFLDMWESRVKTRTSIKLGDHIAKPRKGYQGPNKAYREALVE